MAGLSGIDIENRDRNPSATGTDAQAAPCVLQVIPDLGAGGAEQTTLDVAQAIAARGGRALVASRGGPREAELADMGGELVRMPVHSKNPYTMACNVLRLAQLIDKEKVEIVHARSRAPAWSALAAARIMGVPFMTTYHGTYSGKTALKRWYNSGMVRGDAVIANSHFIRDHIVKEHGLAPDKIDVIPRGSDMKLFNLGQVKPDDASALRSKWTNGTETKVLLLPGRLTRWKGQAVFIEALAMLARERQDWIAVLMGDAQGREVYVRELKDAAAQAGIAERIVFENHCDDMPTAYLASDFVVSPAVKPEAFGRVAVEAQAMGRPPIVADHGGACETVIGRRDDPAGATGWRVKPGDAADLAGAMTEALGLDRPQLDALVARGHQHANTNYSLDMMTSKTLAVYARLLSGKK